MEYLLSALLLIGSILAIQGLVRIGRLRKVKGWSPFTIEVLESGVRVHKRPEVHVINEYFIPFVQYRYKVSGESYVSESISVDDKGLLFDERADSEAFLNSLVDANICYVNLDDYAESVLVKDVPDKRLSHYRAVTVSGCMIIIVSIFLYSVL